MEHPSYSTWLDIADYRALDKRTNLDTNKGRAVLLHSIAHIEYSAIDLALDAAYRFNGLPREYYDDWLEVADDEIRHFLMIETMLEELGYSYGDFAVHDGLFEAMRKTPTFIERMAVVPRYLEAGGLDANPKIIEKLSRFNDPFAQKMIEAQKLILAEEISHVNKGDKWFKFGCDVEGKSYDIYFQILKSIMPNSAKKKNYINKDARLEAGFSCQELNQISSHIVC